MTNKSTYMDCFGELEKHSALVFVVDAASCPPVGFRLSIDCLAGFLIVLRLSKGDRENRSTEGLPEQSFHTLTYIIYREIGGKQHPPNKCWALKVYISADLLQVIDHLDCFVTPTAKLVPRISIL